ncbi:hypothetical protein A3757_05955 [Oleiphilus sp. HI0117]|jgi:AraC-like DNA-binding protein|nr:hypothetical protein A3757_05955 [Oleiphilus sp. HI0117]
MFWMKKTLIRGAIKEHAHNMHEFLVCLSGGLLIEDSLATYTLKQGSAIFIPCNMVHKITIFDGESACSEVLLACIKPATLDLMRSPCNNDFIEKLKQETTLSHSNNDQGDNLERCIQEVDALSMSPSLLNQSFAENCFIKMLLLHMERLHQDTALSKISFDHIDHITAWVRRHYVEDINLDDLSKRFSVSRSQLTRKFKQKYGFSLIEFVLQLRFDDAAKQLAFSKKDITRIALDIGFNNLSHFHRQFKKRFGMTPLSFRNMTAQSS